MEELNLFGSEDVCKWWRSRLFNLSWFARKSVQTGGTLILLPRVAKAKMTVVYNKTNHAGGLVYHTLNKTLFRLCQMQGDAKVCDRLEYGTVEGT
jgi:hypothetical protein